MAHIYDDLIVGAGQGGGPLAAALAKSGRRVALVEEDAVGGTCINRGCTPTKTMVASARAAYLARRAGDYGVHCGEVRVDLKEVRKRKRDIVELFRSGSQKGLEATENLDLIFGRASFVDPHRVAVGDQILTADRIFIDVGTRPVSPKIPGLEAIEALNSTSIMELSELPEHLIVLGAGYVGLEFGQMFRRFGSRVTLINHSADFLRREDRDIAEALLEILREDGIDIRLDTSLTAIKATAGGFTATLDPTDRLEASHLLTAVGRIPNTDRLNLEAAGVALDKRGFIQVDERLQTTVPHIYAIGDCKGGPAFTHISYDDFRILRTNLIEGGDATTTDRMVPYTMYVDPQLGRVGLSEEEARAKGLDIRVAKMPMNYVARALETDESRGLMKVIVDAKTDQILGCAILGLEGGELMSMLSIAMMGQLPYTALADATFAHPTLAESFNNLFKSLT